MERPDQSALDAAATLIETIPATAVQARHLVDARHRVGLEGEPKHAGMRYAVRALGAALDGNGERAARLITPHAREYLSSDEAAEAMRQMPPGVEVDEGIWFLTAVNNSLEMLLMAALIHEHDERTAGAA